MISISISLNRFQMFLISSDCMKNFVAPKLFNFLLLKYSGELYIFRPVSQSENHLRVQQFPYGIEKNHRLHVTPT